MQRIAWRRQTERTSKKTAFSNNKNKTSVSLSKEAKEQERAQKEKGELTIPSLQPTEARGSLTSFPTARKELAETSQKKQKGKANSQTLASSESLSTEAKVGDKSKEKEKAKLTVPSLKPTKARESKSSFLHKSFCAMYARRKGIEHKLAGGTATTSKSQSTKRRTLGAARAERSSFKETMETNLLLTGWLPTKVS